MIIFQNKLLKLLKFAIKLLGKLIYTIIKIENTYEQAREKMENLSIAKTDLTEVKEKLENIYEQIDKKKKGNITAVE